MAQVERSPKDHLAPALLPRAVMPPTRTGWPKSHPAWPWRAPGMGNPQLTLAIYSSASPLLQ